MKALIRSSQIAAGLALSLVGTSAYVQSSVKPYNIVDGGLGYISNLNGEK